MRSTEKRLPAFRASWRSEAVASSRLSPPSEVGYPLMDVINRLSLRRSRSFIVSFSAVLASVECEWSVHVALCVHHQSHGPGSGYLYLQKQTIAYLFNKCNHQSPYHGPLSPRVNFTPQFSSSGTRYLRISAGFGYFRYAVSDFTSQNAATYQVSLDKTRVFPEHREKL